VELPDGTIVTGSVNLWADPAFLDPAAGDYHLAAGSPVRLTSPDETPSIAPTISGASAVGGRSDTAASAVARVVASTGTAITGRTTTGAAAVAIAARKRTKSRFISACFRRDYHSSFIASWMLRATLVEV
jgi:hypothetical protein